MLEYQNDRRLSISTDPKSCTDEFGGVVVLKPIFGSNGQGLVQFGVTQNVDLFFL